MPNIKSAKKRVNVNASKAQRNKSANTALKTALKKANAAIETNADNKNELVAAIVAALLVPVINTGLFALAAMTVFVGAVKQVMESIGMEGMNFYRFLFLIFIGWNFIFEFAVTAVLSPTIARIIKLVKKEN